MANGRTAMKEEFLNWLKSLAPNEIPLSKLVAKVRRLKRSRSRKGGLVKQRMAEEARKGFIKQR